MNERHWKLYSTRFEHTDRSNDVDEVPNFEIATSADSDMTSRDFQFACSHFGTACQYPFPIFRLSNGGGAHNFCVAPFRKPQMVGTLFSCACGSMGIPQNCFFQLKLQLLDVLSRAVDYMHINKDLAAVDPGLSV